MVIGRNLEANKDGPTNINQVTEGATKEKDIAIVRLKKWGCGANTISNGSFVRTKRQTGTLKIVAVKISKDAKRIQLKKGPGVERETAIKDS